MLSERFVGAQPRDREWVPTYQVITPHRDGELDVTILAERIIGVDTHWVADTGKGKPGHVGCTWDEGDCPHHGQSVEYSGWLPVWWHGATKRAALRLSHLVALSMVALLGERGAWMGQRVKLTPIHKGEGRRVIVTRDQVERPPLQAPPPDITRTICVVLRLHHLPMPAAVPPEDLGGEGGGA